MAVTKILIVEDDRNLLDILKYNLQKEGYNAVTAADGTQALDVVRREKPDLIVLDVMLPKLSGFEVCRILRKEMTVPILMLTAKSEEIDKIVGLEIGADDYMTKPFSMRELLARLGAMLRRADMSRPQPAGETESLKIGDLEIDCPRAHRAATRKQAQRPRILARRDRHQRGVYDPKRAARAFPAGPGRELGLRVPAR